MKLQKGELFDLTGKVVAATGGGGVLVGELCRGLAGMGAAIAVLDVNAEAARKVAGEIRTAGAKAESHYIDVLDKKTCEDAREAMVKELGEVDILINGAGGNRPGATTGQGQSFFDLDTEAIRGVFDLNFLGTLIPSQVFGKDMARRNNGAIVNISSMNSLRPLTRIPAYSASKAAVSNFPQLLSVHMAMEYSAVIRVNAIAPGFFLTEQNRYLLTEEGSGELTERGRTILEHTPVGRFGEPGDLLGTVAWLCSSASAFVNGIVVPVDGGFSAYSGI